MSETADLANGKLEHFNFQKGALAIDLKREGSRPNTAGIVADLEFEKQAPSIKAEVRRLAKERGLWDKAPSSTDAELLRDFNLIFDVLKVPEPLRKSVLESILIDLKQERASEDSRRRHLVGEIASIDKKLEIFNEVEEWTREPLRLERPEGSQFHKLLETMRDGAVLIPMLNEDIPERFGHSLDPISHSFVIGHDWAAAFANAKDFDGGEWRMPYEHTAFEFVFSGKRVIFVVSENQDHRQGLLFARFHIGWSMLTTFDLMAGKAPVAKADTEGKIFEALATRCMAQIRAIVIALEAEVAVTEVVRAPHKLNAAREKRGKLPILDYHVVALARRTRHEPLPDTTSLVEMEPRRHPRLHFVRGHWRHFPNHKTWIRWFLRGDADLGYIDKHYKL